MNHNIEDIYSLSPMQHGMLFHSLLSEKKNSYVEQLSCKVEGKLDINAFRQAWSVAIERHAVLRTAFVWEEVEKPLQVVLKSVEMLFEVLDFRNLDNTEASEKSREFQKSDLEKGFNLGNAPLMRLTVIIINDSQYYFVWTHHHILFDGWGMQVILRDVFQAYEAVINNYEINLKYTRPYKDYIAWIENQDMHEAELYWKKRLLGFSSPALLSKSVNGQLPDSKKEYCTEKGNAGIKLTESLQAFAKQNKLTLSTIIQGAWALLLHYYTGQSDIIFGATVSGRPLELPGSENIAGLFINTLPVRAKIAHGLSVNEYLKEIQLNQAQSSEFEYTPLYEIQTWIGLSKDTPLFDSIIVFENYPVDNSLKESRSVINITNVQGYSETNYPLTFVVYPGGEDLAFEIAYDGNLFSSGTITSLLNHLTNLLSYIAQNPQALISEAEILTREEKNVILTKWNSTAKAYPDKCIHNWFEDCVRNLSLKPDVPAVNYNGEILTYEELNKKANKLAHYLLSKGLSPETIVGVSLEKSHEMIVAILAILKAGGAFLPLDPAYPEERIQFMVQDSACPVLLTTRQYAKLFPFHNNIILLDSLEEEIGKQSHENPDRNIDPGNLAYVIYTSGSTGKPKGTLLQHRGFSNFISAMIADFKVSNSSRVLQFASFSFDASLGEIFLALLSGATLYLADRSITTSAEKLYKLIKEEKITTATLPPSVLKVLDNNDLNHLGVVASVGEACSQDIVEKWGKERILINGYGPTEATVGSIWEEVSSKENRTSGVPIGRPIKNVKIYIVNENLNAVPFGVQGEILIGGAGLARGYLNHAALTAEKFIPDPFSKFPGERLYRTGDLGYYLADGTIVFKGRIDHQVKIRGFRIELEEIETQLKNIKGIKDSVVIDTHDETGTKLVAYIITEYGNVRASSLREILSEKLPDYMIPSAFRVLKEFPKSPNGKINRKALPEPADMDQEPQDYPAIMTETEKLIAGIWKSVLHLKKIRRHDNFFELGGHSLTATQMLSRVRDLFKTELPLESIFSSKDLREFANTVTSYISRNQSDLPELTRVERGADLKLSFSQQRLWFIEKLRPGLSSYNIPAAVKIKGKLNYNNLLGSIKNLIDRHEILRTSFIEKAGRPYLSIEKKMDVVPEIIGLDHLDKDEQQTIVAQVIEDESRHYFDLSKLPLIRFSLIRLSEEEHILTLVMHHIISDGWSVGIFLNELKFLYENYNENPKNQPLPELPVQYADYAQWQQHLLLTETFKQQVEYWKEELKDIPQLLQLPADKARPAVQTTNGGSVYLTIPENLKMKLESLSIHSGVTLYMVMLSMFQLLLHKYSSQDDIVVGTPVAGRADTKLEGLIGFFVNNLAIRNRFKGIKTLSDLIRNTREITLKAFTNQSVPFEKLVEELQPERDMSHSPIFQVMFVFQNLPVEFKRSDEISLESIPVKNMSSNFDLSMIITESEAKINIELEYNTDLFLHSTAERMLNRYLRILETAADNSEQYLDELDFLDEHEKSLLLEKWNNTKKYFPSGICVHDWFEEIAFRQPNAAALRFKKDENSEILEITYHELNRRADRLANYIRKMNLKTESLVGILTDRSVEMIVALLGILKAGCAFVPIDPVNPEERIAFIIQDAKISLLLVNGNISFDFDGVRTIHLDSDWNTIESEYFYYPAETLSPDNLAYVIYTSGSTGKPKGTMLRHEGLCNLACSQADLFNLKPGQRVMQFSSLSFDASVWEVVMALLSGATLCLTSKDTITSAESLGKFLNTENISIVTLPPSVLSVMPYNKYENLSTIITAGEAVSKELVKKYSAGRKFFNAYGPTETTVCASVYLCESSPVKDPPIGKPLNNFRLYVLDKNFQLCGIGIPGELCVEGIGLARGYLNRPDLTAEKFIPNPFSSSKGSRIYRTGDRVKLNDEGNIEYLGRIDSQVKLRGFRIEPSEIEEVLYQYEKLQHVIVTLKEDALQKKILATYYVPKEGMENISKVELKAHLKSFLPDYMIPSAFIELKNLPLTISGKVDLRALPAPESSRNQSLDNYVGPKTETEKTIVSIISSLLNIQKVSILDSFFDLGGHSLLATQFVSRIREELHLEIPLRVLFEMPVIKELSEEIEKQKLKRFEDKEIIRVHMNKADSEKKYPLSFAQRRMWFLDQFEPGSPYYNIPIAVRIKGDFNIELFGKVIEKIIERHDSLRTIFPESEGKPYQLIKEKIYVPVNLTDLSKAGDEQREPEIQRLASEEARRPFDIINGPLLRVNVLHVSINDNVVLLTMHHIISDGWSIGVMINEISVLYRLFLNDEDNSLPEPEYQYVDYSAWQKEYLEGDILKKQLQYWKSQLAGKSPLLELPTDKPRPSVWTNEGATMSLLIPGDIQQSLKKFCSNENSTLFMVLLTVLNVLLYRYSNDEDISIGTPIANRTRKEFENIIGLFINTLVLRINNSGNPSFIELLNRVREVTISSFENQDLPFELLVEEVQPDRNMSYPPLFQIMFILQNSPSGVEIVDGLNMQILDVEIGTSTSDMTISVAETTEGIDVSIEYNTDLFYSTTIERFLNHFVNILKSIIKDPMQNIDEIRLLDETEKNRLITGWNNNISPRPEGVCIHKLFERQVIESGNATAVVYTDNRLTYNELNRKANRLANRLIKMSIKPDEAVAICLDRSTEMLVSVLGVLKSGGAYLPMDSSYPEDRLSFMLNDANVKIMITQESLKNILPSFDGEIILIDSDWEEIEKESGENPHISLADTNLAYLIYTSGSTGKPKGTMIPHFSLVNAFLSWQDSYELNSRGRNHLQMASFSFDVFSGDWTRALCSGGKLVITPREILLDAESLYNLMLKEEVNIAEFVPAVLRNLVDDMEKKNRKLDFFRLLIAGSDIWYAGEYKRFKRLCGPQTRLINSFGLTEATIDSSFYENENLSIADERLVPIGNPFANTLLFILDKNLQPVPVGVRGELYVGGPGVARGYHNRPDITAERFIPNLFSTDKPGDRIYRTGDAARYLEDGNIEFLGRIDNQVKLRGFRIEPGEIETVLNSLKEIKASVVIAREDTAGNKRLVGYIVPAEEEISVLTLKKELSDILPDHMVPSAFVILDRLPLTPNGKVDRKALPAPDESQIEEMIAENYTAPDTPVEELIANIWSEVLGLKNIGIYNNFFALGGHSLLAVQVISRIKETFKVEIPLRSIFENQTVASIARVVEKAKAEKSGIIIPPIKRIPRDHDLPLSFAQQRLWFLEQLEPGNPFYNIPEIYRINGKLNIELLEESINRIVVRHEILRTEFIEENGIPKQKILYGLKINLAVKDLTSYSPSMREELAQEIIKAEIKAPLDITKAPLFRFTIIKTGDNESVVAMIIHHIISDNWSTGILFREIALIYDNLVNERPPEISELSVQYADYAYWQREWLNGEILDRQTGYWKKQLGGLDPLIKLPVDYPRPAVQTFAGDYITFQLSKEQSANILKLCNEKSSTLYMLFMAAFQTLLFKYSGQKDFGIGTTIANRSNTEVEKLIGFFVNTIVIRNDAEDNISFTSLLEKVKHTSLDAYTYQDIPFEQVVEALQAERDLSHSPLFQVMFVIQNAEKLRRSVKSTEFTISPVEAHSGTSKFDLTLFMLEEVDGISGAFEYNTSLFDKQTIIRMISHFKNLLIEIVSHPDYIIQNLSLLSKNEEKALVNCLNSSESYHVPGDYVHELIAKQADQNPDLVALKYRDKILSFSEFNIKANKLAHRLIKHSLALEDRAAIFLERSPELLISLLGVLKTGGAYVPIDINYPAERIKYIIQDSRPKVIITQRKFEYYFREFQGHMVFMDEKELTADESGINPSVNISGENTSYIIYTSGSTGNPKGVMVTHSGLRNYLSWCVNNYPVSEGNGSILHSTIAFDATITAIYPSLVMGKPVMILPEGNDIEQLGDALKVNKQFSLIKITPAHMEILINLLNEEEVKNITKCFIIGGENLTSNQIEKWQQYAPGTLLYNEYGPTETVVGCVVFEAAKWKGQGPVPIGKAISNVKLYVLDKSLKPVAKGIAGELYIGGAGLARGYLNMADLTAEAFIPDPFSGAEGARLYKSGDLVKVINDGILEFSGRVDGQIKLRGYRIEPGEVESKLLQLPEITDAVVLVDNNRNENKGLIAYCTKKDGITPDIKVLKEILRKDLPEYMVPIDFVFLDKIPLTVNGKVDRKALRKLKISAALVKHEYKAPQGKIETELVGIWEELLGKGPLGVDDNFFDSGGHSLLAARLIAEIRDKYKISLPIRAVFDSPIISEFARLIEQPENISGSFLPEIKRILRKGNIPLSFTQQRLWFLDKLNPGQSMYNMPTGLRLKGKLEFSLLEESLNIIINRHESLRTVFVENYGIPSQVILVNVKGKIDLIDLSNIVEGKKEEDAGRIIKSESFRPFELDKWPLIRSVAIKLNEEDHILLFTLHHIISDGWSINILIKEAAGIYSSLVNGTQPELSRLPVQYADYSLWQQEYLKGEILEKQLNYWKQQLENAPQLLELPTDFPRPAVKTFNGAHESFVLPEDINRKLYRLANKENVTPFMILLGAFQILLSKYSGQDDILVGTPVANRNHTELDNIIGFFANTVVMRMKLNDDPSFNEILRREKKLTLDALSFQEIPFEKIVDSLNPKRDLSYTPIFQVMFVIQNQQQKIDIQKLDVSTQESESRSTQYDLTLSMEEGSGNWGGVFEYNTDLFSSQTIKRMADNFRVLLDNLLSKADEHISEIHMLSKTEEDKILYGWNNTEKKYPDCETVIELFYHRAKENPGAVAVCYRDQVLTYADLNERSNKLSYYLKEKGVGAEVIVGLMTDRSIDMIVDLLAILKAGGVYLPIDPALPEERFNFIIRDAGAKVILTNRFYYEKVRQSGVPAIVPEDLYNETANYPVINPPVNLMEQNLAYIIYTSGSTGSPKGVMLSHGGLTNLVLSQIKDFHISEKSKLLQFASFSFDASVSEIFTSLTAGAALYMEDREKLMSIDGLIDVLIQRKISVVTLPPSLLSIIPEMELSDLETVISAGEKCPKEVELAWSKNHRFINAYGPTEATVGSCKYIAVKNHEYNGVPIGTPIENASIFILDKYLKAVPVGIQGELYIGGTGLARGYLNKPELTAEKFIPNPFSKTGARIYRTGDIAKYLPDGNIEFAGRADNQVKLRGFRIEPGEIEFLLSQCSGISESAVVLKRNSLVNNTLVAYYVTRGTNEADPAELKEYASTKLPEYMRPAAFIRLDMMPLLYNGKINRKALESLEYAESLVDKNYVKPVTVTEELLASIWIDLLNLERTGIRNNFFELGGHSVLATQLISRIKETFGISISLRYVFEFPAIAELAREIDRLKNEDKTYVPELVKADRNTDLPLSFSQQRLWFLDQYEPESSIYNLPTVLRIKGALNIQALKASIDKLANRHEILRTIFRSDEGKATQVILPQIETPFALVDFTNMVSEGEEHISQLAAVEISKPFDLSCGPLFRIKILRLSHFDHIFILIMHHIISDGWSMGILINELTELYRSELNNDLPRLPELSIQYADYAVWQREWLKDEILKEHVEYWKDNLKGIPASINLPFDNQRLPVQTYNGMTDLFEIPDELSKALRKVSFSGNSTLFMTLLSAFQVMLFRYSGQNDIVIGTPVANRNSVELEKLIGFFVNTLALRSNIHENMRFSDLLAQVRKTTINAYAHQNLPFEMLLDLVQPQRELSYTPVFQVMFVLQNIPMKSAAISGLDLSLVESVNTTAKFDLTLTAIETDNGLSLCFEYNTDLFRKSTIERMAGHFRRILEQITENINSKVGEIDILNSEEKDDLKNFAAGRNNIQRDNEPFASDKRKNFSERNIHKAFEEQAQLWPDKIALKLQEEELTYHELNKRADQVSLYLRELGIKAGETVGLYMDRSFEMVIAILSILKTGCAYVPLDPAYPRERLALILEDSMANAIITTSLISGNLPGNLNINRVLLDSEALWEMVPADNVSFEVDPNAAAYILFTSGSTGRPKGVIVTHENVLRLFESTDKWFYFNEHDVWTLFHSYAFDFSVWELWGSLLFGGRVIIIPYFLSRNPGEFYKLLIKEKVTVLNQTPAAFKALMEAAELLNSEKADTEIQALRLVIFGGDKLDFNVLRKWFLRYGDERPRLVNMYGITETTVHVTYRPIKITDLEDNSGSMIGEPIEDLQIYILDSSQSMVPVNVPGEIYIAGKGLARGYLDNPDLTALKFIANPFSLNPGERLYRSGDLGRFRENGDIEYLGRIDHQVQIRGFRVELGEIQSALTSHPDIREAVVLYTEDAQGEKKITAYYEREKFTTSKSDGAVIINTGDNASFSSGGLRKYLGQKLPEYMIPSYFVELEEIALTEHGKINRKSLPVQGLSRPDLLSRFEEANTEEEIKLLSIWKSVLGIDRIGVNDNFFELGGDSILSIQVVAKANQAGIKLIPKQMFLNPTIRELASSAKEPDKQNETETLSGDVPLTPIQKWFFEHHRLNPAHFNMSLYLELFERLDTDALQTTIRALIELHDALRFNFIFENNEWKQRIKPADRHIPFEYIDLSQFKNRDQKEILRLSIEKLQSDFNLSEGYLFRIAYFELGEKTNPRIIFIFHHLVMDGVSWRIIIDEFMRLYQQYLLLEEITIPGSSSSYAKWARKLEIYSKSDELLRGAAYWLRIKEQTIKPLPVDYPDGQSTYGSMDNLTSSLSSDETTVLIRKSPAVLNAQANEILVTVLYRTLSSWLGETNILIEMEGHGREDMFDVDLSSTVGWFTSIYPVVFNSDNSKDVFNDIRNVKKILNDVPKKGFGFNLLKYLSGNPEVSRQLNSLPRPEINFNYLGQFDQTGSAESIPFRMADDSAGTEQFPEEKTTSLLYVVCIVNGGELHTRWLYSRNVFKKHTIKKLAKMFDGELKKLISKIMETISAE